MDRRNPLTVLIEMTRDEHDKRKTVDDAIASASVVYKALVENGFSREEALQIIESKLRGQSKENTIK